MELASEIGVSQGTVRKALDALCRRKHLVVHGQGRGTFVAEHDEARILFQFFKIVPDNGKPKTSPRATSLPSHVARPRPTSGET